MPPAYETANSQIGIWMMEEGMNNLGSMVLLGNLPCIKCGYGDQCEMSGVKLLGGAEATVASFGVHRFETNGALQQNARDLGKKIREAVLAGK
jgi:hypothetical protein